jgi:hypothetical protein
VQRGAQFHSFTNEDGPFGLREEGRERKEEHLEEGREERRK